MKRAFAAAVLAGVGLVSTPALPASVTQAPCPGTVTNPVLWKQLGSNVLENMLFSHGSLWVSDSTAGSVRRFDSSGAELAGLSGIPSPGGLARGPDGLIYAGGGNSAFNAETRNGQARVVRFRASDPAGTAVTYASGFNMANGMTFGPDGDLFVSNDFDRGLIRIPRADPASWHLFADVWGTNGLVVDPAGENLYAAVTFDQRSPIERIPLSDPAAHATAAQLAFGAASIEPAVHTDGDPSQPLLGVKGLDDMTRDQRGKLYVAANGTGEVLRVDPATGASCLLASGLRNPSSVRIAPHASPFRTPGYAMTLYVVEFSGAIRTFAFNPPA